MPSFSSTHATGSSESCSGACALTSRRCYKPPFDPDKAYSIIVEERGKHFDPQVVEAFVAARDEVEMIQETFGDKSDGDETDG